MRRPLRFLQSFPAPFTEALEAPAQTEPVHYYSMPEPMEAVLQRHHVNPIPLSRAQAFATTAGPRRAVLGVAVLDVHDITPEERADAATYFEAVGPDGAAWMENFCAVAPTPEKTSPLGRGWESRQVSTTASSGMGMAGREGSEGPTPPFSPSSVSSPLSEAELPSFASCGAAKVARRRARKVRVASKTAPVAASPPTSEQADRRSRQHHSASHRSKSVTFTLPVQTQKKADTPQTPSPTSPAHVHSRRSLRRTDEATIVFSDSCVATLPLSVVTAFTDAFQPEQRGVVVRALLPSRGVAQRDRRTTGSHAFAHATPSEVVDSIAAHALAVVNAAQLTTQRVLDRALVLGTDGADTYAQQCAREAKASQRPRFRRRSSMEVYGSSLYTAVA